MRPKLISLLAAFASAFGVSFFAAKTLSELGDWGAMWAQEPRVVVVALAATLVPLMVAWGAIWMIERAKTTYSQLLRLAWMTALAWGWLYLGLVVLGIMRLQ